MDIYGPDFMTDIDVAKACGRSPAPQPAAPDPPPSSPCSDTDADSSLSFTVRPRPREVARPCHPADLHSPPTFAKRRADP